MPHSPPAKDVQYTMNEQKNAPLLGILGGLGP